MDNNERRAVVLPHSLLEALDKYAASTTQMIHVIENLP